MTSIASGQPNGRSELFKNRSSDDQMTPTCSIIEVHLRELSQLFDALDPSPFREKDLDGKAEEYIVESAKELPSGAPCTLLIHLDQLAGLSDERVIGNAIRLHFARRSRLLQRDLRRLLRRGWFSLGIGMAFLTVLFTVAQVAGRLMGESGLATLFREGLIIIGWVAMWRPLEIFLYDWWPIVGQRRLYDRLSGMSARIVHEGAATTSTPPRPGGQTMEAARALARWEGEGGRVLQLDNGPDGEVAPPTTDNAHPATRTSTLLSRWSFKRHWRAIWSCLPSGAILRVLCRTDGCCPAQQTKGRSLAGTKCPCN